MIEQTISVERMEQAVDLFGSFDENIKIIEHELGVSVVSRDSELKISGEAENVLYGVKAIQGLLSLAARKETITEQNVRYIINLVRAGNEEHIKRHRQGRSASPPRASPSRPRPWARNDMWTPSERIPLPWGWGRRGPARPIWRCRRGGRLRGKQVNRIILTRPAVEAGSGWAFCRRPAKARWTHRGPCND